MSKKHNYTNYAAIKQPKEETPVVESEVTVEEVIEEVVDVVVEPIVEEVVVEEPVVEFKPNKLTGVVANCDRLNVRKGPSTTNSIVGVLTKGAKVTIESGTTKDFYEISTSGVKGYCMKQYIEITD